MTEEEERSQRQQAFDLIAQSRSRVNPLTTEHIAENAQRHAEDDLHDYAEFLGWKQLVRLQEDDARAHFRPNRSGHKNASGRYSILTTPWRVGELAKPLGELNLAEVQEAIAAYQRRAEENTAEADRLGRIAAAMIEEEAQTVADLGEERVLGLYVGETSNV